MRIAAGTGPAEFGMRTTKKAHHRKRRIITETAHRGTDRSRNDCARTKNVPSVHGWHDSELISDLQILKRFLKDNVKTNLRVQSQKKTEQENKHNKVESFINRRVSNTRIKKYRYIFEIGNMKF